jgi:hypothetical protein
MTPIELNERCLVGAVILQTDTRMALERVDAAVPAGTLISPIWGAIRAISARGGTADIVGVVSELGARGDLERVGGSDGMMSLIENCPEPTMQGVNRFSSEIAALHSRRTAQALAVSIATKISKGESLDGDVERLEATLKDQPSEKKDAESLPAPVILCDIPETTDWVFEPLYMRGGITQIQGAPKGGKSSFALYTVLALAYGEWRAGKWDPPTHPIRTLYIPYEDGLRRIKRRLISYARGMGYDQLPENLLLFRQPPILFFPKDLASWIRIIKASKCDVVVFDTLAYIHSGDENKATDMSAVMASIKRVATECNCAVLLIHHNRKPSSGGDVAGTSERGRGSTVIAGAHDIIVNWGNRTRHNVTACEITSKEDEGGESSFEAEYIHLKNEDGKISIGFEVHDLMDRENTAETKAKFRPAIEEICSHCPDGASRTDISEKVGLPPNTVSRYLHAMKSELEMATGKRGVKLYRLKPIVDISGIKP